MASQRSSRTSFERALSMGVAGLLVYTVAAGIWEAARLPFWYDEIFTVALLQLPTFGEILGALYQAADSSGPLFYVIQHLVNGFSTHPEVAYRLPSIFAVALTCWAAFVFVRHDGGAIGGVIAVMILLTSQLYHGFSVEARSYAVMVMFIAWAAVAWQRANRLPGVLGLGVSLAAAVLVHYYAVFVLVPFAIAEAVHLGMTRRPRWRVWAALSMGPVALAAAWPLLMAHQNYYGAHYWSRPTLGKALETYDRVLSMGWIGAGFGIATVLGFLLLLKLRQSMEREVHEDRHFRPSPDTLVLVMAFLALPLIVVAVTSAMHGGFTFRYSLGVLLGLAWAGAYVVAGFERRAALTVLVIMAGGFTSHELAFWASGGARFGTHPRPTAQQGLLIERVRESGQPLVVADGADFLPLAYYDRLSQSPPITVLVDPEAQLRYTGSDSLDLDLLALRRFFPIHVVEFERFVADHQQFTLLVTREGHWWQDRLLDDGYHLILKDRQGPYRAYRVNR